VAALNRGGFLSVVLSLTLVAVLEPKAVGRRLAVSLVAVALVTSIVLPLSLSLEDTSQAAASSEERALTPSQVVENILSIMGRQSEARGNLGGTKEWRMEWWTTIVNYTVNGPLFWTGRGFGANLADEDGFQVAREDEAPLRSPHNIHMTFLARMGVPGALAWAGVLLSFALSMLAGSVRARMQGATWWARVHLWVLGYWCAFLINASFDVFLEGPQGGIWFWSVTGLGIGVAASCRRDLSAARRARMAA
jgi:O-antigen ligase